MDGTIKNFTDLLINGNLKEAAKLYFDMAWRYQKQFNHLLEKMKLKDKVFGIMYDLPAYGEYVDQP